MSASANDAGHQIVEHQEPIDASGQKANNADGAVAAPSGDASDARQMEGVDLTLDCPACAHFFVSPTGDDAAPGTQAQPFKTIARARDAVRLVTTSMKNNVIVTIRDGWYFQAATLAFDQRDSGLNGFQVIYKAAPGEHPVVSGGRRITGWTIADAGKNVWKASAPSLATRQLYVNDQTAVRARNDGNPIAGATKTATGYIVHGTVPMATWHNPSAIEFVYNAMHGGLAGAAQWVEPRVDVDSIAPGAGDETVITMKQPAWTNANRNADLAVGLPSSVENAYELLDQPGEWYLDSPAGVVYYMPRSGEDLSSSIVIAPVLETLVSGMGTADAPLHDLEFQGLAFAHATWLRPSGNDGFPENQANYTTDGRYTPGNVQFHRGHDLHFERCVFTQLGGAGLELTGGVQNTSVMGCRFGQISGSAIVHGTVTDAPRNDMTLRDDGNTIQDCYLEGVADEYHGACGIFAGYVSHVTVGHNEIADVPYTAVSTGWGWGTNSYATGNRIFDNYVHGFIESLGDGGAFYSLSAQPGSELSGNWMQHQAQDVNGGAIYPDEGSSGWNIHDNVCDDVHRWLNIWTGSINNINVHDNFSNSAAILNNGTNITLTNNTVISGQAWPDAAKSIMTAAGLESTWKDVKTLPGTSQTMPLP